MGDALLGLIEELNDFAGEICTKDECSLLDRVLTAVETYQNTPGLVLKRCCRCGAPTDEANLIEVLEDDWILVCNGCYDPKNDLTKDVQ